MKINENTQIIAGNCILVPYEATHVPKYHKWMEDEEIRRLTGSERLTLEEEYDMQKSWRNDEDKLTFIILDKKLFSDTNNETESMVGDVNLFINDEKEAEVEIMIAEESARGKGIGSEAIRNIISYAIKNLKISEFFVKITDDNVASLNLFENKLEFERVSHSKVFEEYTLKLPKEKMNEYVNCIEQSSVVEYQK